VVDARELVQHGIRGIAGELGYCRRACVGECGQDGRVKAVEEEGVEDLEDDVHGDMCSDVASLVTARDEVRDGVQW